MLDGAVDQVRSFNRLVVQRVGALNDRYLSSGRPLGEARVLWEIRVEGSEVRQLRSRLELDSGYLSRLLRSLEDDGLVTVQQQEGDQRVRTARLTPAGIREHALLDQRSDELARSFLLPLSDSAQARLVAAMADVERLLTAAMVEIQAVDPSHPDAQRCLREYVTELGQRFEDGFDPALSIPAELDELRPPAGLFLLATLRSEPVGCGALKFHGSDPAELKRMWVATSARGLGIGRRLLGELERHAAGSNAPAVRLETNKTLTEAISLYRSAGYKEVSAFNNEPYANHWFEKALPKANH
jgi:DNA-binding MarR family transcriptional regulator/GNAT superfamily N-acetyltransferase